MNQTLYLATANFSGIRERTFKFGGAWAESDGVRYLPGHIDCFLKWRVHGEWYATRQEALDAYRTNANKLLENAQQIVADALAFE